VEIILIILILILGGIAFFYVNREFKRDLSDLNRRLENFVVNQNTNIKDQNSILNETQKQMGERLEGSNKIVGEVQNRLGRLETASQQIFELGKDIRELEYTLKAPKLRGVWSELFLDELLAQTIPKDKYSLQYTFKSGQKVDAAIHLRDGTVCVDAKFPLENFKKIIEEVDESKRKQHKLQFVNNIKKHIDDIRDKYIVTSEGTFDFALMYIPSEGVYYEILSGKDEYIRNKDIDGYARKNKVIPVSPSTFYSYLQTILMGLKGMHIEKSAKDVLEQLTQIRKDFVKFTSDYRLIGTHIKNVRQTYEKAEKSLGKFDQRLTNIDQSKDEITESTNEELSSNIIIQDDQNDELNKEATYEKLA